MELCIRPVRPDDAEAIVGVLNPIIEAGAYTVFDAPLTPEAERRYIEGFPARGAFHVAESLSEGRVVGFQSLEPFAAYTSAFDHVGVIGTYAELGRRREGIGLRLSEATFEAARQKGFEKLFTYVRGDNAAALAFYLRLGFRVVGRAERQACLGGRYVDEVIIERFL